MGKNKIGEKLNLLVKEDTHGQKLTLGILKHKYNPDADIDSLWTNMKKDTINITNINTQKNVKSSNPFVFVRHRDKIKTLLPILEIKIKLDDITKTTGEQNDSTYENENPTTFPVSIQ